MTAVAARREPTAVAALAQRLRAAGDVLLVESPAVDPDPARDAAQLLSALVGCARDSATAGPTWLLLTAVTGAYPTADDVVGLRRALELTHDATDAELMVMDHMAATVSADGLPPVQIEILEGGVVVDVDFSAQNDKQTGIQRVTRRVCALWDADHSTTLLAWSADHNGHRRLTRRETLRVLRHGMPVEPDDHLMPEPTSLLCVPWRCTVVLTEVPPEPAAAVLAALAEFSGSDVVAIGYDAIPVTSAELRPVVDAGVFVKYLTVLKHARRIAGISASSASEFRGFSEALAAQGLPGPSVVEVMLATQIAPGTGSAPVSGLPRVLCIGSHELHKNHLAVLHCAEMLWRSGLEFELHFVGGDGWDMSDFRSRTDALRSQGRPLVDHGRLPDDDMWRLCRDASFTVFPSLHEGFGLPVSESLACGTPVITTDYGSTREIAAAGGCVLVDPRDDAALEAQMRRLLTNPEDLARLRAEARAYEPKTWSAYASELWEALVTTTVGAADEA
ncbi:glycosyltransferase [Pengzhenrongella frigida]|uniref:Glycosyltransferase family 1 protein n=1 Tax=Pengzhenrongella frigida TaxID=1259133 RepID=A0A4Q5N026_9MICO|nr:glycosyltransferase [Cellulomonas sp. HLT2-17]RYV51369.1 glycosyltransferase family 1 protein [Cellulomonas sp. HLT2-17]